MDGSNGNDNRSHYVCTQRARAAIMEDSDGSGRAFVSSNHGEDPEPDFTHLQHIHYATPPTPFNFVEFEFEDGDEDEAARKRKALCPDEDDAGAEEETGESPEAAIGEDENIVNRPVNECDVGNHAPNDDGFVDEAGQTGHDTHPTNNTNAFRSSVERGSDFYAPVDAIRSRDGLAVGADDFVENEEFGGDGDSPLDASVSYNDHVVTVAWVVESLRATLRRPFRRNDSEIIIATPSPPWWKSRSTKILIVLLVVVSVVPTIVFLMVTKDVHPLTEQTDVPSMQPSSPPTFDQRPTLEIVQERGRVLCGLGSSQIESGQGFYIDLCRAIASVLFGNPDSFMGVTGPFRERFQQLNDRKIDLLIRQDTRTVEREVNEKTTGVGYTFSSPYFYDGLSYLGNETFVQCSEEQKRYDECSSLKICVHEGARGMDFVQTFFPSDFLKVGSSRKENEEMLANGTCNVYATDRSVLFDILSSNDTQFVVGDRLFSKEPLAVVTRKDDPEFSSIINWVMQALFYGEEQGLTKDSSLCQNYTTLTSHASQLNFMLAVHCMGNYRDLFDAYFGMRHSINQPNNGTGMIYAIPFGDLSSSGRLPTDTTLVENIRHDPSSQLRCGVIVPDGYTRDITAAEGEIGMGVEYCRTLAAAVFNGNFKRVKFLTFSGNDNGSFLALRNGTIDVLAGGTVQKKKYDFFGIQFSTPYYFGNETAGDDLSFFSLATRGDDEIFSSFTNLVVLATIYAQEQGIKKEESNKMPLISLFGSELSWAMRDAIFYSGSYDDIYIKNFGSISEEDRGRNTLNNNGGPQIHSFPGLSSLPWNKTKKSSSRLSDFTDGITE